VLELTVLTLFSVVRQLLVEALAGGVLFLALAVAREVVEPVILTQEMEALELQAKVMLVEMVK
jgi:hypothetical protein